MATKNGLLMPELMLTKARWNKKVPSSSVPASNFQPALSPIQDFIKDFPRVSGCPPKGMVVLCQPGTPLGLSRATTAQDGTLSPSCGWQACCGFEVATSWTPGPGKAGECLQHPAYSSIPALAFCSQGLWRLSIPGGSALPAFLPHESRVSKAISSSRKSFPQARYPCSPHAPSKPWKVPASHSD